MDFVWPGGVLIGQWLKLARKKMWAINGLGFGWTLI